MQPGGWCCRLQVAAAPPGALGLARPCLAGQQQDLHITTLCTYATVLRWRHTLKLSLFERVGQELMIRQRKLGFFWGFEDCARLGMAEFYKRWLKLDIYGGSGALWQLQGAPGICITWQLTSALKASIYEPGPEKVLLFGGCDGCEYYFKLVLGQILQI